MKHILLFLTFYLCQTIVSAQKVYEIDVPSEPMPVTEGKLNLGGTAPDGGSIEVNSYYMRVNGKPVIPVMGEFHFTRYPREQWDEEIMKIKAGGITILPTYVFWSLHEEEEGRFVWSGNRDLRYFIELCKKHELPVIVRIGPFCHGEIRNGGLPDWLLAKPLEIRSNDKMYLSYVKRLYNEIGKQLKGLYYKDGGPVVGCQIENEMQHSAAPWALTYPGEPFDMTAASFNAGEAAIGVSEQTTHAVQADMGNEHMRILKQMAVEAGIITPIYTATGWGNAAVIGYEAIPVTSAYTYPFWAKPAPSPFCMFKNLHKQPDYSPVRYHPEDFPSFCAEMGVGIQMIYSRRPVVTAKAAEALMVRTLGSGSNGIGYYMYHGGSTPRMIGGVTSFQDQPMGMPKVSYDFQAPLGEFGLEHPSYRYLRTLHTFLADFGEQLAPMETVLPKDWQKMTPQNRTDLRYALRVNGNSGYVFMVNFQDHDEERVDLNNLKLKINLGGNTVYIPEQGSFTLPKDVSMILPVNLDMNGATLRYSTAQLLAKIEDGSISHYFFFAHEGVRPEFVFDKETVRGQYRFFPAPGLKSTFVVQLKNKRKVYITTLTHLQALNTLKTGKKLVITDATALLHPDGKLTFLQLDNPEFEYVVYTPQKGFVSHIQRVEKVTPSLSVRKIGQRRMALQFQSLQDFPQIQEYFLRVKYIGDVAMAFINGKLMHDHFFYGAPWMIGLKRYMHELESQEMTLYIRPLRKDAPFLGDLPKMSIPDFSNGPVVSFHDIMVIPEYRLDVGI